MISKKHAICYTILQHTQKRLNTGEIMFNDELDGECHLWELQRDKDP